MIAAGGEKNENGSITGTTKFESVDIIIYKWYNIPKNSGG